MKNMVKKLWTLMIFVFISTSVLAQSLGDIQSADAFWKIQSRYSGPVKRDSGQSDIEGSPYLSDTYQEGSVVTTGNITYVKIPLRYNIYSDNFEFKIKEHQVLELANPDIVKEIRMGGNTYIRLPYITKYGSRKFGFFIRLCNGKAKALKHYDIRYIPAKQPGAYQDAEPARFGGKQDFLFVYFGEKPAVRIIRKNDLLDALPAHRQAIARFIKKEHIKVRKDEDLVKVINYYNSL
jgi:hypothetical protein